MLAAVACTGGDGSSANDGEKLATDAAALQSASAAAMGEVVGARFTLERSGAPVYIDATEAIGLDSLEGVYSAPASAQAELKVTVNDALRTRIGAVAIDEEIWLSNPVTGTFETLPPGFDIDPSSLFDPKGAWQPLLESLDSVEFVAEEQRDGVDTYHLTGTAPEARIRAVTADLVRGSDVDLDLWLDARTALVRAIEFDTEIGGSSNGWVLELDDYGETFEISDPTVGQ